MSGKKTKTYVWKDPTRLAKLATLALIANAAVNLALLLFTLVFGQVESYLQEQVELTAVDWLALGLGLFAAIAILALITVPWWIVRASINAHNVRPNMQHSVLGSIGWYFVPIAWFVLPYQAMSEIWEVSASGGGGQGGRRAGQVLNWWWGSLVLSMVAGLGLGLAGAGSTVGAVFEIAGYLLAIAVSLLLASIILKVSHMQVTRQQVAAFGESAPTVSLQASA